MSRPSRSSGSPSSPSAKAMSYSPSFSFHTNSTVLPSRGEVPSPFISWAMPMVMSISVSWPMESKVRLSFSSWPSAMGP